MAGEETVKADLARILYRNIHANFSRPDAIEIAEAIETLIEDKIAEAL